MSSNRQTGRSRTLPRNPVVHLGEPMSTDVAEDPFCWSIRQHVKGTVANTRIRLSRPGLAVGRGPHGVLCCLLLLVTYRVLKEPQADVSRRRGPTPNVVVAKN